MELRRYAALLWRWSWLIALITVLAAGAGWGISLATIPIFEASTKLMIDQSRNTAASTDYNSVLTSERLARTYAQTVVAKPVLDKVIAELQLPVDAAVLSKRVTVSVLRDTQLIVLKVEDADPIQAQVIADEIVKQFRLQDQTLQASRYAVSKQALQTELTSIQKDIEQTQASLQAIKTPVVPGSQAMAERDRLDTLLAQYRSSYTTLLKSLEDIRLAEAVTANNLVVVEPARAADNPARPKTLLNVLLGTMVGLLLAVGVVVLRDYLDDTVKSADEVERLLDASALGLISTITGPAQGAHLVTKLSSRGAIAEAYRVLSMNVDFSTVDGAIRTLLITSGGPGEGKSTTASNLALTMAQMGKQVILVDADLRKPALGRYFGLPNVGGVTNALLDKNSHVADYLMPTGVDNLRLLPSGPIPPNSAKLLGSQRMLDLIEELRGLADIIIFDSPPALVLADSALLARACDAALLVIRAGATTATSAKKTQERLLQAGTRVIGFVLNRVSVRDSSYYYAAYYTDDQPQKKNASGGPGASSGGRRKPQVSAPPLPVVNSVADTAARR
jgi:non-specific protein-tyrosine kinase